jgi:magnesium transporter
MKKSKVRQVIRPLRLIRGNLRKAGMPPGTVVYTGEGAPAPVKITLMDYDANVFKEQTLSTIEEAFAYKTTATTTWINIDGLSDVSIVEKIGKQFDLHPLVMEDIAVPTQRPKVEDYDSYFFIVLRMLQYDHAKSEVTSEQISMILRDRCLITFQENVGDVFDNIRDRIRNNKGRVRKMGTDYLAYGLIDAIVDHYFVILDTYGEKIETLEDHLLMNPSQEVVGQIHEFKRELTLMRKCVWPMRELASAIQRSENDLITDSTRVYFRDVYDHTIQIIDTIEGLRDIVASLLEIYLSSISNRMNAQMKMLSLIATIFMPLSFLAGVFGMNFEHFPEVKQWSWWTYPYGFWGLIAVVATTMIILFKRQKLL